MIIETGSERHSRALRVWAGCLACYNAGRLVGHWIDAVDAESVTIDSLHRKAGARRRFDCEEIWCLDVENFPIQREMGLMEAAEWGRAYAEVEPSEWEALSAWVCTGAYVARGKASVPSISDFHERYQGHWELFRAFVENQADETALMEAWPELAVAYFNWAAWTRDVELGYEVQRAEGGGVHVFQRL